MLGKRVGRVTRLGSQATVSAIRERGDTGSLTRTVKIPFSRYRGSVKDVNPNPFVWLPFLKTENKSSRLVFHRFARSDLHPGRVCSVLNVLRGTSLFLRREGYHHSNRLPLIDYDFSTFSFLENLP